MKRTCKGSRRVRSAKAGSSSRLASAMTTTLILTGSKPIFKAASTLPDLADVSPPGQFPVAPGIERIKADVHPAQTATVEIFRHIRQENAIGGEGKIFDPPVCSPAVRPGWESLYALGAPSGEANLPDSDLDCSLDHPVNLFKGQNLLVGLGMTPSCGMQYTHRKLQRSVTEIRM